MTRRVIISRLLFVLVLIILMWLFVWLFNRDKPPEQDPPAASQAPTTTNTGAHQVAFASGE
jgi:hypothetical protein